MASKKKIGKGVIMDIDMDAHIGRISSTCLDGLPVSPAVEHSFTIETGETYHVNDEVLFVEKSTEEAENVIVLPPEGGCI